MSTRQEIQSPTGFMSDDQTSRQGRDSVSTTKPQVGKRYRVTIEGTVDSVGDVGYVLSPGTHDNEYGGEDAICIPFTLAHVEELPEPEPEYVEGALYLDADGGLFQWDPEGDAPSTPWKDYVLGHRASVHYPAKPLERLYREDER